MSRDTARGYAALVGVVLIAVGLIGFVDNPLVGRTGLFTTDTIHNLVHIVSGAIALAISFGRTESAVSNGLIGFGVLYAVVFVLLLVSPTMFGILTVPVNGADHVLHAALAIVSLAVGFATRAGGRMVAAAGR
jgi:hypothetical protein